MLALQQACEADKRDWLLEVLAAQDKRFDDASLPACVEHFYRIGLRPDWWKLPPPEVTGWARLEAFIERHGPYYLGAICRGFPVGRPIFDEPAVDWFVGRIDDAALRSRLAASFRLVLALWRQVRSWSAGT